MFFIQEFICQRTKQLQSQFDVHFKHIVLQPNESFELKAGTDIYLISDIIDDVKVESENGIFNWDDVLTNEQVYEHSGDIFIENLSSNINQIPLIQFTIKK
jgi:DUF4097 and DUF4098 domain-containing protein YvlB